MKRKEKRYLMPDVRPLDQRSNGKRIKPGQSPDAQEQLIFTLDEPQDNDLQPDYIKKMKLRDKKLL